MVSAPDVSDASSGSIVEVVVGRLRVVILLALTSLLLLSWACPGQSLALGCGGVYWVDEGGGPFVISLR